MIAYKATKQRFLSDVKNGDIEYIVLTKVMMNLGISVGRNEIESWKNSLQEMYWIMDDSGIPDTTGIAIEYRIPQTAKRLDFVISGTDGARKEQVIIVELKQWSSVEKTDKDAIVVTRFQHGNVEHEHPSYQAWSYANLLTSFNATVYEEGIGVNPCAYLHNYKPDGIINDSFYDYYIEQAPLFLKGDKQKLQEFIKKHIKYGDDKDTIFRIDNGKIRPSKSLADSLSSMLKGNREFIMIDEQKIVYENAVALAKKSNNQVNNVLIVEGGPGTGKSVVAINLMVGLTKLGQVVKYVTKNAAPRNVYESVLVGHFRKSEVSNMFSGSGSYTDTNTNTFDTLIVDEAHRLNAKSGMFKNLGENQIKEIINSAKCSIFFIDENQKVTWSDIGTKDEIKYWAKRLGANVTEMELTSQFRCNGSDGYIAWLDNFLGIRETANTSIADSGYDFKVVDSPNELRDMIFEKNKLNNKARLVAGYCWDWISKKTDTKALDVAIPEFDFAMKWNLATDKGLWIMQPKSVTEVGCIHTCQGLDLDYIGVIIGKDWVIRNGQVVTFPSERAKTDTSLNGFKKDMATNKTEALKKVDLLIKNTYRTLMTRGMKGCYVFFVDVETREWVKNREY